MTFTPVGVGIWVIFVPSGLKVTEAGPSDVSTRKVIESSGFRVTVIFGFCLPLNPAAPPLIWTGLLGCWPLGPDSAFRNP
ncbi:MAG: hypothetical protein QXH24_02480, partial [Candidatus Bathyarchaeia archaeon]